MDKKEIQKNKLENEMVANQVFFYHVTNTSTHDIIPIECGKEKCKKDKEILHKCYNYYAFHCVIEGKGFYKIKNKTYEIRKNTIFAFFPGEEIIYYPDKNEPWEYCWINFIGIKAKNFCDRAKLTPSEPIYQFKNPEIPECFEKLLTIEKNSTREIYTVSYLYEIFAKIIEERENPDINFDICTENYLTTAVNYISKNIINSNLSIKDLSKYLSLSEGYLSRIFKNNMGLPFSKFVNRYRIQKACDYLENTIHTNKQIALMIGYANPLYFNRKFNEIIGTSPQRYRKMMSQNKT
jgi:AraC family transcriptional regulator of arabinose operon